MSLGSSQGVSSFHTAIIAAREAGIVIVAAAGNSAGPVEYPGAYPEVIAVAATNSADAVGSFSCFGPEIDLAAPGVSIFSTVKGGGYATYSGTSMASPHVAGVAALVLATSSMSPDSLKTRLQATAFDLGVDGWDSSYGYGLIDALKATGS
jgi:subtilisin family serine protease